MKAGTAALALGAVGGAVILYLTRAAASSSLSIRAGDEAVVQGEAIEPGAGARVAIVKVIAVDDQQNIVGYVTSAEGVGVINPPYGPVRVPRNFILNVIRR